MNPTLHQPTSKNDATTQLIHALNAGDHEKVNSLLKMPGIDLREKRKITIWIESVVPSAESISITLEVTPLLAAAYGNNYHDFIKILEKASPQEALVLVTQECMDRNTKHTPLSLLFYNPYKPFNEGGWQKFDVSHIRYRAILCILRIPDCAINLQPMEVSTIFSIDQNTFNAHSQLANQRLVSHKLTEHDSSNSKAIIAIIIGSVSTQIFINNIDILLPKLPPPFGILPDFLYYPSKHREAILKARQLSDNKEDDELNRAIDKIRPKEDGDLYTFTTICVVLKYLILNSQVSDIPFTGRCLNSFMSHQLISDEFVFHYFPYLSQEQLNWQDQNGNTLLHIAAHTMSKGPNLPHEFYVTTNKPKLVHNLCRIGVNVTLLNKKGETALSIIESRFKSAETATSKTTLDDDKACKTTLLRFHAIHQIFNEMKSGVQDEKSIETQLRKAIADDAESVFSAINHAGSTLDCVKQKWYQRLIQLIAKQKFNLLMVEMYSDLKTHLSFSSAEAEREFYAKLFVDAPFTETCARLPHQATTEVIASSEQKPSSESAPLKEEISNLVERLNSKTQPTLSLRQLLDNIDQISDKPAVNLIKMIKDLTASTLKSTSRLQHNIHEYGWEINKKIMWAISIHFGNESSVQQLLILFSQQSLVLQLACKQIAFISYNPFSHLEPDHWLTPLPTQYRHATVGKGCVFATPTEKQEFLHNLFQATMQAQNFPKPSPISTTDFFKSTEQASTINSQDKPTEPEPPTSVSLPTKKVAPTQTIS